MSLINDALAKAQAEKDNRYLHFDGLLQTEPAVRKNRLKYPMIVMAAILAVIVLGGSLFWVWQADEAGRQKKSTTPPAAWTPSPEATRIYMDALNHQRNGEYAIAEVLYRQVIAMEPNHPYALNNLGVLQMLQRMPDKAIQLFERAIALKEDYVHPHYNLACIYAQQNKVEESLRHLQKALVLKPDMQEWAEKDKDLMNLRENREFKKLMEKKAR
jgi:tetratricopeptide (TPR) repeat protein